MAKSDSDTKERAEELDALLREGKKKTLNFVLMKAKDGIVLEGHPTKSPKALVPAAKEKGGLPAVSVSGTMDVRKKMVELTVLEEDPPENIPMLARRYVKSLGLRFNFTLIRPDGTRVGDGDPEPDDESEAGEVEGEGGGGAGAGGDDLRAALADRIRALAPRVRDAVAAGIEGAASLGKGLQTAAAGLASGAFDQAGRLLDAIEARLAQPVRETGTGGDSTAPDSGNQDGDGGLFDSLKDIASGIVEAVAGDEIETIDISDWGPKQPPKDYGLLTELNGRAAGAGKAARETIDQLDHILRGADVTPDYLSNLSILQGNARSALAQAKQGLKNAEELGWIGTDRSRKIAEAKKEIAEAQAKLNRLLAQEQAARKKKMLLDELSFGRLSKDAPQPYGDKAQAEIIKAIGRDPAMASFALDTGEGAVNKDAMAENLGKVLDHRDKNFASARGKTFANPEASQQMARDLLKMGSHVGPEYFARLDDYVGSGRHLLSDPMRTEEIRTYSGLNHNTSMHVGKALVKEDGSIDVKSGAAKDAIGDALFHPTALLNPLPSLNAHMLKTVKSFEDPKFVEDAGKVLKGMSTPTNGAALDLIRRSHGKKNTDPVTKRDGQVAVMGSMLKSLDQGNVGSCFATAPTRRMRETDPLGAMKGLAQIAGTGKFKPPFGPEVPAVTNIPPDEDPLMRSLEYSTATSTARRTQATEQFDLAKAMAPGFDGLSNSIKSRAMAGTGGMDPLALQQKQQDEDQKALNRSAKLKSDVLAAVEFTYDPLSKITNSKDGSSTQGRYVVYLKNPKVAIDSKEKFVAAMSKVALTSMGLDPKSPEALEVLNYIKSDVFINAVCPGKYKPWELEGGGQTTDATQTLHGDTLVQTQMLAKAPDTPQPDEGPRTREVLEGLLNGTRGMTGDMVTIRTVGMHGFNALPTHPSLAKLQGSDPTETTQKVQTELVDKGNALKTTDLSVEKAQDIFDREMKTQIDGEEDPEIKRLLEQGAKTHRPTTACIPGQIALAIAQATDAANVRRAAKDTDAWALKQKSAPTQTQKTEKQAELRKRREKSISDKLCTRLIRDMGAPEFVIADTNWGSSGRDHTFFVVAPDPITGDPVLWLKSEPPGSLTKATRDWIDHEWAVIK
jgi:hypothetical protein